MTARTIVPGVTPNSWEAYFSGGPMDGQRHGLIDLPELPTLIDWKGGRYRLLSKSAIDADRDLSHQHILRGCRYAWEVPSRAEESRPGSAPLVRDPLDPPRE